MTITLADVQAASTRIADGIYHSPCPRSVQLSELCGMPIYCKLDYLQRTGSFKERGARNALILLTAEQKAAGVIAASAGNHALGLAYHGSLLGIGVTVVMPRFAPLIKVATCRRLGANIVQHGETFAEARAKAHELAAQRGLTYVHGMTIRPSSPAKEPWASRFSNKSPTSKPSSCRSAAAVCWPESRWRSNPCARRAGGRCRTAERAEFQRRFGGGRGGQCSLPADLGRWFGSGDRRPHGLWRRPRSRGRDRRGRRR